jgi:hypothetical protein
MKYAVEMGSGVITYITRLMKTGSGIQKLITRNTQTHRQYGNLISLFFFQK